TVVTSSAWEADSDSHSTSLRTVKSMRCSRLKSFSMSRLSALPK
ncbi:MAG: hypothetical protein QOG60_1816, partial [Frankiaceae bacterium]|nr:hypothetical protein [Frankiaceae bacterium]